MMQPPGSIEQLNNFRDSMQSPDGLDRLRAMQYVQASSQGLSGMPQVTAPPPQMQPQVPMMNRAYGGEIGTGGLINVLEDGTQVFNNSQEGALNRATHGGVLEGYNFTPSTGGTATGTSTTNSLDAPGTLAASGLNSPYGSTLPKAAIEGTDLYNMPSVQAKGGIYNVSDYVDSGTSLSRPSDAPETIPARDRPQTLLRDPETGKIPWGAYVPQDIVSFGQGYDLKDVDYFTANAIAQKDGAERFIYNNEYARTDPGLLSNYNYNQEGTKPWQGLENTQKIQQMTTGMYAGGVPAGPQSQSMTSPEVMAAKGYVPSGGGHHSPGTPGYFYKGINPERRKYLGMGVYADYKHGGQITARAYGGEIGTGGLLRVAEDGTQIFDNSQEGALNRATHGGVLEGYNYTPSTGGTATATPTTTPITTNSLDAPGTLAAGGSSSDTGASTGLRPPTSDYDYLDIPATIKPASRGTQTPYRTSTGQIPFDLYVGTTPTTFGQGFDLKDVPYLTANRMAQDAGADRFIYNDEYAGTASLPDTYDVGVLGTQVWRDDQLDKVDYTGTQMGMGMGPVELAPNPNSEIAMAYKGYVENPWNGQMFYDPNAARQITQKFNVWNGQPMKEGGQITARAEGGQVDPAQAAQGLASFGRNGDSMLLHIQPEELDGLASLGNITYNPVTGLPEAFSFGKIFKSLRKLAPIVLAIAAPYAFGATTALGIGASTALGSFAGNMIAGAKPGDALKAGLMSGLFAGGGAYLGGASSGFGGTAAAQGGTSAVTSGVTQGLNVANPAFVANGGSSVLQTGLGTAASNAGNAARSISQFGGTASSAPVASLAGGQSNLIQNATNPLSYSSANVPSQYSGSMGNANQIGLANANVASPVNVAPVSQFAGGDGLMAQNQIASGTDVAQNLGGTQNIIPNNTGSTSIFAEGGLSKENLGKMGGEIYDKYSTPTGIAKLVGMDLSTPDWEAKYAAEAAAKNQQLTDAGYTVETGFDGQTVIRDSSGVVMPRNLTVQDILNRALGKSPRTNLVARTDYRTSTPEERAAMQAGRGTGLAQGGLIGLKHGGEFSGMVPGNGHGMEDNVYMPIVEKGEGSQVGTLAVSPSEYVVDSYTMAALGNGNADAGAKVMDNVVKGVRKKAYGNMKQPNEINGLSALQPMIERV